MIEPSFDREGYPTEETIATIRDWEIATFSDAMALMDFVGRAWSYPEYWKVERDWLDTEGLSTRPVARYVFSTIGWSGNEELVGAMEENTMLQIIAPWSWRRGGHYEYRIPEEDAPDVRVVRR